MTPLSTEEAAIVDSVASFVERDVRPSVRTLEHAGEYPQSQIETMKRLGIFGLAEGLAVRVSLLVERIGDLIRPEHPLGGVARRDRSSLLARQLPEAPLFGAGLVVLRAE